MNFNQIKYRIWKELIHSFKYELVINSPNLFLWEVVEKSSVARVSLKDHTPIEFKPLILRYKYSVIINEIDLNHWTNTKRLHKKNLKFYQAQQQDFIDRGCPGCGELREFEVDLIVKDFFTYFRCKACWSIFRNPGATKETVSIFYEVSEIYKFFKVYLSSYLRKT